MTMLSGSRLSPSGRRHPAGHPVVLAVLLLLLLGGAAAAGYWLLHGRDSTAAGPVPTPCTTSTTTAGAGLPAATTVTVNVYNATDRAGLARHVSQDLSGRGFGIGRVANDPLARTIPGVAEIRYGPAGLADAKLVLFYVPGARLVPDQRGEATVDVVVGEKFVAVPAQAAVAAALAKQVKVVSPACPSPTPPSRSASPSGTRPPTRSASPHASGSPAR